MIDEKKKTPGRAWSLMVLGTASHSGKSTIAAALCRLLARAGIKVAPFKAQNMSLNSFVTPDGGEIGRAQAAQARAAGIEPHVDMNPVLLKPTGENLMQVIVCGQAIGNSTARDYYARKGHLRKLAFDAYDRLAARHEAIVLEGAGSPAEINLREEDFVNTAMAEHAGAKCVLVADIDRGGVFASILGTISLLPARHRKLLAGVVINKFRGDVSLLAPGIREIEGITGVSVLGVLPYVDGLDWEEEDSLGLEGRAGKKPGLLDVAVVRLPYMSNYTDFQPVENHPAFSVRYVSRPDQLGNPDLIFLPGSKNVQHDAEFLRSPAWFSVMRAAKERRMPIFGICGGYQILGLKISDPYGMEGDAGETSGLGFLPVATVLERQKELCRVEAENVGFPFLEKGAACAGYEIHMGRTDVLPLSGQDESGLGALRVLRKNSEAWPEMSGYCASDDLIFGCYMHGLFENPAIVTSLAHWLCARKGLPPAALAGFAQDQQRDVFDKLADVFEREVGLHQLLDPENLISIKTQIGTK